MAVTHGGSLKMVHILQILPRYANSRAQLYILLVGTMNSPDCDLWLDTTIPKGSVLIWTDPTSWPMSKCFGKILTRALWTFVIKLL